MFTDTTKKDFKTLLRADAGLMALLDDDDSRISSSAPQIKAKGGEQQFPRITYDVDLAPGLWADNEVIRRQATYTITVWQAFIQQGKVTTTSIYNELIRVLSENKYKESGKADAYIDLEQKVRTISVTYTKII